MDKFTIVIPFYNGHNTIYKLLRTIPSKIPIIIVDDMSDQRFELDLTQISSRQKIRVLYLNKKGYFTGAVNEGIKNCETDVLILNQDSYFDTLERDWLDMIAKNQNEYGMIGEGVAGVHPAWKKGYIHGTFMWIRRDVIDKIGLMNQEDYPLWGSTCEYQLRACRAGYKVMPYRPVVGFNHSRRSDQRFGSSIQQLLSKEPENMEWLIRVPPMISVIIPTYKHGKFLKDAVNSLVGGETSLGYHPGQTFASFEVIIVDDHSPDETGQIAKQLVDPWKGVHYIRRHQNGGTAAANNTGIQNAHGKYITIMCGDDMMEPDRLETLYRFAQENPNKIIYDNTIMFADESVDRKRFSTFKKKFKSEAGQEIVENCKTFFDNNGKSIQRFLYPLPDYDFNKLINKNHMHCGIFFKKEWWVEVGGYPAQFSHGREDWAMNVRFGVNGYCGLKVPNNYGGYLYRQHEVNRTIQNTTPAHHGAFLKKIQTLHPQAYLPEGERPMACCGGRRKGPVNPSKTAKSITYPGSENGMTLVEYLGGNFGRTPYYGAETGHRYLFGASEKDKVKNVANEDVQGFLDIYERRNKMFRLFPIEEDIQDNEELEENTKMDEPEPEPEPEVIEEFTTDEVIEDILENAVVIDPNKYSVRSFKKELSKTSGILNIDEMVELEREGKNRVTIIAHLEDYEPAVG